MSKYKQFIFENYEFDAQTKVLTLHYSLDGEVQFTETYRFLFDFKEYYAIEAFTRACELLFLVAGVSYYKTYIPPEIVVKNVQVDKTLANFLSNTYQKGLGEFFYVNDLDPRTEIVFPTTSDDLPVEEIQDLDGLLVGIGGGKDSLTTVELLRDKTDLNTWSLNHKSQLSPLVERIGLPHAWVEREWDPQLKELVGLDALNGHVPISAIFACVGVIVAILTGKKAVVTSNEQSANEPTLMYQGVAINHQYSKSQEFEQSFQVLLKHLFGESVQYYSFLRPLSELRIAEIFAKRIFEKYKDVFSSCNRAYVATSDHMSWCGECPKCAFTFLALTPFLDRSVLEALFGGKNLLLNATLEPIYKQLLGIEGDKPLECVGEIKESRAAMRLAQKQYPELEKYQFELPEDYDYRQLAQHSMPDEIYNILLSSVS